MLIRDRPAGRRELPDVTARSGENRPGPWPAVVLAAPAAVTAGPIVHGLNMPRSLLIPAGIVAWLVWAVVVHRVAGEVEVGNRRVPRSRVGFVAAVVAGLIVALAWETAVVDREIEALRGDTTARERWNVGFEQLAAEKRRREAGAGVPDRDGEPDSTTLRLEQRFRQVTADLPTAERAVVCERDGTCGSRRPGAGPNYWEKVRARDELRREFDAMPRELDARRTLLADRAAALGRERAAAGAAAARIDKDLTDLEGQRPGRPARLSAGLTVAADHLPELAGRWLMATALLVADLVAVVLVAGFWLRRHDPERSTKVILQRQHELDRAGDGPGSLR